MYIFTSDYIQYIHVKHVRSHRVGPHVFYMFYMNILYVIGCKNIQTVLLKLYNQFYMNILYKIICENVYTFMKKNIWTPRVFLIFYVFLKNTL